MTEHTHTTSSNGAPAPTPAEPPEVRALAQRIAAAQGLLALQPEVSALADVRSNEELAADRDLAKHERDAERELKRRAIDRKLNAARRADKVDAQIARQGERDAHWHRRALAAQRRATSATAQLATLSARATWSSRALIAVVVIGMAWAGVNVQHNLVPDSNMGNPLYWLSYGLEAMISIPLILIMIVSTTAARRGKEIERGKVIFFELALLTLTLALNTGVHIGNREYGKAAEYGIAPVMVGVVIWLQAWIDARYAVLIEGAHEQVLAEAVAEKAAAERAAAVAEPPHKRPSERLAYPQPHIEGDSDGQDGSGPHIAAGALEARPHIEPHTAHAAHIDPHTTAHAHSASAHAAHIGTDPAPHTSDRTPQSSAPADPIAPQAAHAPMRGAYAGAHPEPARRTPAPADTAAADTTADTIEFTAPLADAEPSDDTADTAPHPEPAAQPGAHPDAPVTGQADQAAHTDRTPTAHAPHTRAHIGDRTPHTAATAHPTAHTPVRTSAATAHAAPADRTSAEPDRTPAAHAPHTGAHTAHPTAHHGPATGPHTAHAAPADRTSAQADRTPAARVPNVPNAVAVAPEVWALAEQVYADDNTTRFELDHVAAALAAHKRTPPMAFTTIGRTYNIHRDAVDRWIKRADQIERGGQVIELHKR